MDLELIEQLNDLTDSVRGFFIRIYPLLINARPMGFLPYNNRELSDLLHQDYSNVCKRIAALSEAGILKENGERQMYCPLVIRIMVKNSWSGYERRKNGNLPELQEKGQKIAVSHHRNGFGSPEV